MHTCVAEADGDLKCEAGACWEDVNQTLKDKAIPLFFPVSIHTIDIQLLMTTVITNARLILDQGP